MKNIINKTENNLTTKLLIMKCGFSKTKEITNLLMNKSKEKYADPKNTISKQTIFGKRSKYFENTDLFFKTMATTVRSYPSERKLK